MSDRDMVSKAEVLDIYAELYDEFDDAPGIIKALHKVCDKIKRLQPQKHVGSLTVSGWISIDDELPEPVSARNMKDIKPVMLYSPKGGYYVGWYYGPDWNGKKLFINRTSKNSRQYITTKVTHWMPLPGSPEVNE